MQFAICNEIFRGWKLDQAMNFAAKTGYDAIEIAPFTLARYVTDLPPAARQQVRESAQRAGLAISGIHWVLAETEGLHLTHPDQGVRERTARYLCELVDFCGDIGGNIIVVGSPKQRSLAEGISQEQGWEWAQAAFSRAVDRALHRGLTICLEPLAPTE